ncbi:MAG: hypothetical protein IJO63_03565 [Bacilli bacterium]|nr:hypothetical protein [Bacilli bacterium]
MKEILNYINNNAILASLLTLLVSTIIQIFFRRSDRKYNEKQEKKKNKRNQFENKPEFVIVNGLDNYESIPHIDLFMTDFIANVAKDKTNVEFYYFKDVLNKEKYKHLRFCLKNIGNTDIDYLDICVTSQRNNMLCDVESIKLFVENKAVNYNYLFDRKVLKGTSILIDIAYLPDSKIFSSLSSELSILFRDSYGNLYAQPFFLQRENLYAPRAITYKEYNIYTKTDTALECFKNPVLW